MTHTISGLFDDYFDARAVVEKLDAAGVPRVDISIVVHNALGHHSEEAQAATVLEKVGADAGRGVGLGAIVGGAGGLLAGLGLLVMPGVGPVVAGGWLAAASLGVLGGAAVGGVAGAAAGGLVGALMEAGVPDDDANVCAEGVRRGGTLVSARVPDDLAETAHAIIKAQHSVDLAERGKDYRAAGWTKFDPAAAPYSAGPRAVEPDRTVRR